MWQNTRPSKLIDLAGKKLSIFKYSASFSQLAARSNFDDETIKSFYWMVANFYSPLDLWDLGKGTWRKTILCCLQCAYLLLMEALSTSAEPEFLPTQERSLSPPQNWRPYWRPPWTLSLGYWSLFLFLFCYPFPLFQFPASNQLSWTFI